MDSSGQRPQEFLRPICIPLLGLGCDCLAGDGFCAARLRDARFARLPRSDEQGPSLQDKEIRYLLAVRGVIQAALGVTRISYQISFDTAPVSKLR